MTDADVQRPHIRVGTEDSPADWDLDVYLDGERLELIDQDGAHVELQQRDFHRGILQVSVSWDNGLSVSAVHCDDELQEDLATIPHSHAITFPNETKLFVSEDERYATEIELRRV